ncbi:EAL domain-containing protein [Halomonas sp. HP20-15]|uniref:putative bifunctional diguanylate cyclase/phosphodiesterase n=1 Tax=Halomonas sp. HP20-15 TaxID=3085901 RepID=UPI0029817A19|nr:EAL domain-containing protein [Halomonas sp. HP20-15]MDW5376059.1 EAL domain-containing protein [Halomonas sp. HP20-15]
MCQLPGIDSAATPDAAPHADGRATPDTACDYLGGVFQAASEAIIVTDIQQRILDVNPAFVRLTGFTHEAMLGRSTETFIVSLQQAPEASVPMAIEPRKPGDLERSEITYRNRQGRVYPGLMSTSRVRDEQGHVSHHLIVLADLSLLSSRTQHVSREVYFDALTGLPNAYLLTQLIHESMRHARRSKRTVALCALDIDHFKAINDRLGHEAGDILLALFARRIGELLQGDDILARLGGDEFVLLLHRQMDDAFFEALLTTIRRPFWIDGHCLHVSASLGVTYYPSDDVEDDLLLRHANQAMYRAKQLGRDTFCHFDPNHDRQLQQCQEKRQRFAQALGAGELRLHYQPQVDMASNAVVGVEALIRWQHPEDGLLLPGAFLPLIEDSVLELDMGEWVIDQALRQLQCWQREGIELPIHINISPTHLLTGDFIERLVSRLAHYPEIRPGSLKLEVLETAAMHDIGAALDAISQCQALGIDIAMDDFGTGFSSLTYLRQLPVDLIKIDQSFVRGMLIDPDDMAIVESVIYMAQRFGKPMLAEGVESLDHARALLTRGCQLAQGFGIARPMPAARLLGWLAQWPTRRDWHALASV